MSYKKSQGWLRKAQEEVKKQQEVLRRPELELTHEERNAIRLGILKKTREIARGLNDA